MALLRRAHTSHVAPEAQSAPSVCKSSRRPKGLGVQGQSHPWEESLNWGNQEGAGGDGP